MGRKCSVCQHPERAEIDRLLLDSEPIPTVSIRFGLSGSALKRHKANHLDQGISEAVVEVVNASPELREREIRTAEALLDDIRISNDKLDRWEGILEKLLEAAEEFIGAPFQAEKDEKGRARLLFTGKALLQTLAELRKLLAGRHRFIDLEARVLKIISADEITINVLGSSEWIDLQERIYTALLPFPEARQALFIELSKDDE